MGSVGEKLKTTMLFGLCRSIKETKSLRQILLRIVRAARKKTYVASLARVQDGISIVDSVACASYAER